MAERNGNPAEAFAIAAAKLVEASGRRLTEQVELIAKTWAAQRSDTVNS